MTQGAIGTGRVPAVAATNDDARAAAEAVISEGGTALEAVFAGYLAAAGATAWAALAPLVIGVAGAGAGAKLIDGRARQPGLGLVRPQRYARAEDAPAMSRIAVPASGMALSLAAAGETTKRLALLASAGVRAAKHDDAPARARLVQRMGEVGGLALNDRWFLDELAQSAPRIDGSPLTIADLDAVRAAVEAPREPTVMGGRSLLLPSWAGDDGAARAFAGRDAIVVGDARGALAGACWEQARDGVPLFGGEILLPALAVPMIKGVPRTRPGAPIETPAPIGFVVDASIRAVAILATTLATLRSDLVEASAGAEAVEAWMGGSRVPPSLAGGAQLLIAVRQAGPKPTPVAKRIVGDATKAGSALETRPAMRAAGGCSPRDTPKRGRRAPYSGRSQLCQPDHRARGRGMDDLSGA